MKFSIRDVLWATATVALITGWIVTLRQQASQAQTLSQRLRTIEDQAAVHEREAERQRGIADQLREAQRDQHQEIVGLRQLLKQSLGDQRDWFELQVDQNRLVAVYPATLDSSPVTATKVREIEKATGFDGKRLRHFLTPIDQLRPKSRSYPAVDRPN